MIARPLAVAWKELVQLRRDRLTLAMVLALPIMQLLLFGYAINTDVRHVPLVVDDRDGSPQSRDLVRALVATGSCADAGRVRNYHEIERALRSGQARAALVIPPGHARDLARGQRTAVQLILDGSDPQSVASATSTAAGLASARAVELQAHDLAPAPLTVEPVTWYNPELRTAVAIVPGLVGVILTMTMVMLTAMAIVRERERGTLEQLIVSPVGRVELVLGKILPYVVIGYAQMTVILLAGAFIFAVPLGGSLPLLYSLAFLFIAANLALGLCFSTLARTQQQAMQMSFFFLLPNILLSGFMFPFASMPRPAQILAEALPLTHFLRIIRGVTLKDAGFADLAPEVGALGLILTVLVAVAAARFRKKLD